MPQQKLSLSLRENLSRLDSIFGTSSDFYTKQIELGGVPCAIVLFTGISSPEKLWIMALDALQKLAGGAWNGPALLEYLLKNSPVPVESTAITDMTDLTEKLSNGMSVLLLDGCSQALAVSTQEMPQRSVGQPNGEGDIHGVTGGLHRTAEKQCLTAAQTVSHGNPCGGNSHRAYPGQNRVCALLRQQSCPARGD